MPKFVIEREIPDAGKLSQEQLRAISQTSCGVLRAMGPQTQWVQASSQMTRFSAYISLRTKRV